MAGEKGGKDLSEASTPPPHYHGHRERLRERFLSAGSAALSDYELIELVLFRALPRRDVKPLAKDLIARFGSFAEVVSAPAHLLAETKGLGDAAIAELKIVEAAAQRLAHGQVHKRTVLSSWTGVLDYCRTAMAFADREQLRILFLDKRNRLIADELQQEGTVDHTPPITPVTASRTLSCQRMALLSKASFLRARSRLSDNPFHEDCGGGRRRKSSQQTDRLAQPVRRPDPPVPRNETELHVDSLAK